jgi:hypothetical protein
VFASDGTISHRSPSWDGILMLSSVRDVSWELFRSSLEETVGLLPDPTEPLDSHGLLRIPRFAKPPAGVDLLRPKGRPLATESRDPNGFPSSIIFGIFFLSNCGWSLKRQDEGLSAKGFDVDQINSCNFSGLRLLSGGPNGKIHLNGQGGHLASASTLCTTQDPGRSRPKSHDCEASS